MAWESEGNLYNTYLNGKSPFFVLSICLLPLTEVQSFGPKTSRLKSATPEHLHLRCPSKKSRKHRRQMLCEPVVCCSILFVTLMASERPAAPAPISDISSRSSVPRLPPSLVPQALSQSLRVDITVPSCPLPVLSSPCTTGAVCRMHPNPLLPHQCTR